VISQLVDLLFGCSHKRLTFPMTIRDARRQYSGQLSPGETYVTCLRCGREFPYDWHRMKVVSARSGYALAPRPESVQSNLSC
jgi:hypothetical protein